MKIFAHDGPHVIHGVVPHSVNPSIVRFFRRVTPFANLSLLGLFFALPSPLRAQTALPPGGEPLLAADALASFRLTTTGDGVDAATFALADASGPWFKQAAHIETKRDLSPAWAVEFRAPLTKAVKRGDTGFVRFFARSPASADETGTGRMRIAVQQASPDYVKSLETQVNVGREWQEFLIPFTFTSDHAPRAAEITFGFGYKRETLELGGIEVLLYGAKVAASALPRTRFSYDGREAGAAWRTEALARIERLRKGDFSVRVVDAASGAPVSTAQVRIEERRAAFQFGTALQFTRLVEDTPDNLRYREKFLEFFNAASPENDLKWPVWLGEWGSNYSHQHALDGLHWLNEHHIPTRGHILVWPSWKNLPKKIGALRGTKAEATIPQLVLDHIREMTTATKGQLIEWDVLNEPYDNHDLMTLFGNDIMTSWFQAARAVLPHVPLYLNDYNNHDMLADREHFKNFYRTVLFLQKAGAPLGGIGIQGHFSTRLSPPENILATFDLYSNFKLPLRITEFDVTTDDEQLQADYTRDFLILCFSHPSVIGVQAWGFWEKAHWRPNAAMFRADWSEKPNARVYRDLVLNQWRTRVGGASDSTGRYTARGFFGDYIAIVESNGRRAEKEFQLRAGEAAPTIEIKLP